MSDDPVLNRPGFPPDGAGRPGQVPEAASAPGEWMLSRWRVQRSDAARTCAELARTLTRLGAAADDRAHAVAAAWAALRLRLPALVTFRLTNEEGRRNGVLAVDEEVLTTMQLPGPPTGPSALAGAGAGAGGAGLLAGTGGAGPLAWTELAVTLLDIIADQDSALDHHRRELESTDRGLLALHTEQAEQLTLSGERQRELLETEQAARAVAEAARARLAFLSHVGAVLGASLDHRQVVSRLSTLLVPRYAGTAAPDQATVLAVPLTSLGTVLGVLSVTPPGRPFAHDDVIIVSEVARRAAAALANALRFEQEREVAERLRCCSPDRCCSSTPTG